MSIFAVLYMMSSATALLAGLPQIRQLLIVKRSDELSLSTWLTWVLTQSVSLLYVISIGEPVMMVATAAPASWGFLASEINAGPAIAIWLRAA